MTLSRSRLHDDELRLVRDLARRVGERALEDTWFDPADGDFRDYERTSFAGLQNRLCIGPVRETEAGHRVHLTPHGWLIGITGMSFADYPRVIESSLPPTVAERMAALRRTFKARVKDRGPGFDVRLALADLSRETRIPSGWIRNCLDSQLIAYAIRDKDGTCWFDATTSEIVVPVTFMQPRRRV